MSYRDCPECGLQHPQHKMSCSSKESMEAYMLVVDKMYCFTDNQLSKIEFEAYSNLIDRNITQFLAEEDEDV